MHMVHGEHRNWAFKSNHQKGLFLYKALLEYDTAEPSDFICSFRLLEESDLGPRLSLTGEFLLEHHFEFC